MQSLRSIVLVSVVVVAAPAAAQSDPAGFGTVYNIGTVPPGSIFDVPGAVTGTSVGDGSVNSSRPVVFLTPTFLGGSGLGPDSQLNVFDGGTITGSFRVNVGSAEVNMLGGSALNNFSIAGGRLNVLDGFVGGLDAASGSRLRIAGGELGLVNVTGTDLQISGGDCRAVSILSGSVARITGGDLGSAGRFLVSTVNISGGVLGTDYEIFGGNVVNMSGGTIGDRLVMSDDVVNISGGAVGIEFEILSDNGTLNLSGGTFGRPLRAARGTVNLFGTSFFLNGVEIPGLVPGQPFTITQRGNLLSLTGTFVDGTPIDFILNSLDFGLVARGVDLFRTDTTLTVTLVPGPADFNLDGAVDVSDVVDFTAAADEGNALAQVDDAPAVDFFDVIEFLRVYDEATN